MHCAILCNTCEISFYEKLLSDSLIKLKIKKNDSLLLIYFFLFSLAASSTRTHPETNKDNSSNRNKRNILSIIIPQEVGQSILKEALLLLGSQMRKSVWANFRQFGLRRGLSTTSIFNGITKSRVVTAASTLAAAVTSSQARTHSSW